MKISGKGTIDGNGELWWKKYWNMHRNDYEPRGLRWATTGTARFQEPSLSIA